MNGWLKWLNGWLKLKFLAEAKGGKGVDSWFVETATRNASATDLHSPISQIALHCRRITFHFKCSTYYISISTSICLPPCPSIQIPNYSIFRFLNFRFGNCNFLDDESDNRVNQNQLTHFHRLVAYVIINYKYAWYCACVHNSFM